MFNAIESPSRCGRSAFLETLFFAISIIALPVTAFAQCPRIWDATGEWQIRQGPEGKTVIRLNLEQSGSAISGIATRDRRSGGSSQGNVAGDADGNSFGIGIDWLDGGTDLAVYRAQISPTGKLAGETYIGNNKTNRESWVGEVTLTCPTTPIRSMGQIKPIPRPSGNPTRRLRPPYITASQVIIPSPVHPFGIVFLQWDGGPDHPNVEVVVSLNNGAHIPAFSLDFAPQSALFKQPKIAGVEMKLERKRLYKYVLKAEGKTLSATSAFYVP